jgi:transcription antitermination factor NusG
MYQGRVGKLSILSKDKKYTVTFLKMNGETTAGHIRVRESLLADQLVPGYNLKFTPEEKEFIDKEAGNKVRRTESNRSESLKLVGKIVRFKSGMFQDKLGVVNSVSSLGLCNTSLCHATDDKRSAYPYARPHTLEAVDENTVLTEEQKESLSIYTANKEKLQHNREQKQLKRDTPRKGTPRKNKKRNQDNKCDNDNDNDVDDDNNDEEFGRNKPKIDKLIKKEYPLTGKYVRIQSGSFAGKLGRAVNHTVGNIYCVCVLNEVNERKGRQTSVTASRLEEIDVSACNQAELDSIEDDKQNLIKREEKRLLYTQQIQQEKERAKAKQARALSATRDDDSDTQSRTSTKLPEIPSNAVDSYVRVQTGRYEGFLARVTNFVGRYRCTVKILELEGSSKSRGTTVTTTNFCPADLTSLSEEDNIKYLYDLKTREAASLNAPYPGSKPAKQVFTVDLTGQYVRLYNGLYGGKVARVTYCVVGTSPCYVKVH